MPLFPPPILFEHPADLVIDVFGTFLGKRSERMIVRWRDRDSVQPPTSPSQSPLQEPTDGVAPTTSTEPHESASGEHPQETTSSPLQMDVTAAMPVEADGCVPRDDSAQEYTAQGGGGAPVSEAPGTFGVKTTGASEDGAPPPPFEHSTIVGGHSDSEFPDHPAVEQTPVSRSADQLASQLIRIWGREAGAKETSRPTPAARLCEQLEGISETPANSPSSGVWKERAVPMSRLRSVTVSGRGVTVSSDLINALVERGIALSFLGNRGEPIAQLSAPGLGGTVQTRRSQLAAYDSSLGVDLAVEFIRGKLRNQKHQLQYSGKYLKTADPSRFDRVIKKVKAISALRQQLVDFKGARLDDVREKLMGYEGTGARMYWEAVAILLEGRVEFSGRITRGAIDPVNSALNYGYGILYGQVSAAVVNAGLELYAGFLHVDRPGKPALVLDLVEEFRAPVVDRSVLAIVNQGIALETDAHGLTAASRKIVADRVLERLSTSVPYEGKRWPLRTIIQNQARHLAVAVRGEREYRAFASRW